MLGHMARLSIEETQHALLTENGCIDMEKLINYGKVIPYRVSYLLLQVVMLGFFCFYESPFNINIQAVTLVNRKLKRGFLGGVIATETFVCLDELKENVEQKSVYEEVIRGSPWLLQI
ncbi:hypothetical protein Droror1_Dr00012170 [Drosera rotundifolia]